MAAVASYHNLGGLKQQVHALTFWRLEDQNEGVGPAQLPPEALREILFPASPRIWWLQAYVGFQPHHSNICLAGHVVFCHSDTCPWI